MGRTSAVHAGHKDLDLGPPRDSEADAALKGEVLLDGPAGAVLEDPVGAQLLLEGDRNRAEAVVRAEPVPVEDLVRVRVRVGGRVRWPLS